MRLYTCYYCYILIIAIESTIYSDKTLDPIHHKSVAEDFRILKVSRFPILLILQMDVNMYLRYA